MNIHSVSLKGLRDQNEDKHNAILNIDQKKPELNNINYFAIFDGHGGKEVSKFLNINMPKYFFNKSVSYPIPRKYVSSVFDHLQKNLQNQKYSKHCGSTALIVLHYKHNNEEYINVINTGDCRCILCRDNFAMPLTKDHKPNWPEERARIENLGGNIVFDGFDFRIKDLSVSRAFGDIDATPYVTHTPDLFRYKLEKTDKFIVLGCDGLFDQASNDLIVNFILLNAYDMNTNKRINKNVNIAKKLAEFVIQRGSTDNVSVIIIFFD